MSITYAEYELNKVDASDGASIRVYGAEGGVTRTIAITPETFEKLKALLMDAPECNWIV
jgi:hypothetical protein